jgi:DNA polymerase III delta prime subunit
MHPFLQKMLTTENRAVAYLLMGSGSDKEAREFSHSLICEQRSGCGECPPCQKFLHGTYPDFLRIESDKGTIRIDAIREMIGRIQFKPMIGRVSVVVIDQADRMTEEAANALLKTLEEPPSHAIFILTTSISEKLPATLKSRCQKIFLIPDKAFNAEAWNELLPLWREKILPIFSRPTPFSVVSSLVEEIPQEKEELLAWLDLMKVWWRDLAVFASTRAEKDLLFASPQEITPLLVHRMPERIFEEMDQILETERAIEGNVLKPLALERLLTQLVRP